MTNVEQFVKEEMPGIYSGTLKVGAALFEYLLTMSRETYTINQDTATIKTLCACAKLTMSKQDVSVELSSFEHFFFCQLLIPLTFKTFKQTLTEPDALPSEIKEARRSFVLHPLRELRDTLNQAKFGCNIVAKSKR